MQSRAPQPCSALSTQFRGQLPRDFTIRVCMYAMHLFTYPSLAWGSNGPESLKNRVSFW